MNPCLDPWLKLCLSWCIRKVSKPVCKKDPITSDMMKKLFLSFAFESCSLSDLRDVTIYLLAFAVFFSE